jgi:hypothetical protein
MASYLMGTPRSTFSHVMGSTAMFINVVNAILACILGALVCEAAGAPAWLIALIGALCGLSFIGIALAIARRTLGGDTYTPRFPTPQG